MHPQSGKLQNCSLAFPRSTSAHTIEVAQQHAFIKPGLVNRAANSAKRLQTRRATMLIVQIGGK
jgi:hypothetical protein